MNTRVAAQDVERFRGMIGQLLGLHIGDGALGVLADLLDRRLMAQHQVAETYISNLETHSAQAELAALAQELTVGETYFFRNTEQFRAVADICLPDLLQARVARRRLRLLSAGCASGEEAYSLAMLVREQLADPSWEVSIQGVDLNPVAIEKAALARYSSWSLRETPAEIKRQWFRMEGREAVLDQTITTSVRFEQRNLIAEDVGFWQPESYDIIFCRNVLMYFTPSAAQAVIGRITRSLSRGGYLFLGHAETLRGLSFDFHLHHTHGTFYYQRREPFEPQPKPLPSDVAAHAPTLTDGSATWVQAIQRASARIQMLTSPLRRSLPPEPELPNRRWDLDVARDLLQRERFAEALKLVENLPTAATRDPEVLLLRAVLLTHIGRAGEAETPCRMLLELDELHAGAHYVLALSREERGDRQRAIDHDLRAISLDRTFAMPHLHLGLLARKAGERQTAQREFDQASILLQREDPARLLLFGGGFGRDALVALCQAERGACSGPL